MSEVEQRFARYLRGRHRGNHGRRTAASHAAFLLPHLRPGMRVLDLGCGPASITAGLAEHGDAIGIDLDPGPAPVPLVAGDATCLPFPPASFDAVFSCAVLQHLADPLAALLESRRVCRPGAVVGIADADWRGALRVPDNETLQRGDEVLLSLRSGSSPHVGADLRGLLRAAGFERPAVAARGQGGGDDRQSPAYALSQAAFFESPEAVAVVVERGLASRDEMAAIGAAWRSWGAEPGAVTTGWWFEAVAWTPGPS